MKDLNQLIKIHDWLWEIPKSYRADMQVPARIYASKKMLGDIFKDRSVEQLINVATLPGIKKYALAMPDIHEGYGFPIGGVAAMNAETGIISPGGIGYDINCGVRLLLTDLSSDLLKTKVGEFGRKLFRAIPSGAGRGGGLVLDKNELDEVLRFGMEWTFKRGYAEKIDLEHVESGGILSNADLSAVSDKAKKRGADQLGTMGAGNHFVEVDRVEDIYDEGAAKILGIFRNQTAIMVHCGSRGLGHQVATDYIRIMMQSMPKYGISLLDRELACVPFSSTEGQQYFNAMAAAANFAWANRQLITYHIRQIWKEMFGGSSGVPRLLYDVAHNIAKIEEYEDKGRLQKAVLHRKGATRAFPPGHKELKGEFQRIGQPVIIPGSMGTASYVLLGTKEGVQETFGSCCHGAGRQMSRHAAKKEIFGKELKAELADVGIQIESGSYVGLAEEAPFAYKDVDEVVKVVASAGIAKKVARLKPLIVVKG